MDTIQIEYRNKTAILKLNQGTTNAINQVLVKELAVCLQQIKDNTDIDGLVLGTANDKFFSIGFDIPQLSKLDREEFITFFQAFNRFCLDLYTLPKPTVAAITGHATAGGCILPFCCDYRFIADSRKLMGLNEIKLGVPVPYPADCMLRDLVGTRIARNMMESGKFFPPDELLQMGVVDQLFPIEQVIEKAIQKVETLSTPSLKAYATIKRNRTEIVEAQILSSWDEKGPLFADFWFLDETRKRLDEASKKF